MLLWLWCRPAAAAPIQLLAWDLSYAAGVALKSKKKKKYIPCYGYSPYIHNHLVMQGMLVHLTVKKTEASRVGKEQS